MEQLHIRMLGKVFRYSEFRSGSAFVLDLLARAHETDPRAECLCAHPAPPLYVGRRGATYYLAKMPYTGPKHDPQCEFYEAPLEDSGRRTLAEDAIVEEAGHFDLKLGVPLKEERLARAPRYDASGAGGAGGTEIRRSRLGLLALLHFLWESSRNTMWFPIRQGRLNQRRSWSQAWYFLTELASRAAAGGTPLREQIYIVPAFRQTQADALRASWEDAMRPLRESASQEAKAEGRPILRKLLLGEVRAIEPSMYGYSMRVKNFAPKCFFPAALFERLTLTYPFAMQVAQAGEQAEEGCRCIAMALFESNAKGDVVVKEMALMATTAQYLPVSNVDAARLANHLVGNHRQFECALNYADSRVILPDFFLLDANEPRIPLLVARKEAGSAARERRQAFERHYAEAGKPAWIWPAGSMTDIPDLPSQREKLARAIESARGAASHMDEPVNESD